MKIMVRMCLKLQNKKKLLFMALPVIARLDADIGTHNWELE
jgi:hypothetical protein